MPGNLASVTAAAIGASNGLRVGVVLRVVGGQPVVDIGGAQISNAGTLASYTPTTGDTVAVLRQESTWLILGRILGTARRATTTPASAAALTSGVAADPLRLLTETTGDVATQALAAAVAVIDHDFVTCTGPEVATPLVAHGMRLRSGTAYEVLVSVGYHSRVVGQYARLRLRRGRVDGPQVADLLAHPVMTADVVHAAQGRQLLCAGDVDVVLDLVVTVAAAPNAPLALTASPTAPASLEVRATGPAEAFPHAVTIADEEEV